MPLSDADGRLLGFRRVERDGRASVELRVPAWIVARHEELLAPGEDRGDPPGGDAHPGVAGVVVSRAADGATHLSMATRTAAENGEDVLLREAEVVTRSGSWELDARTGALRWSANLRRMFGLTADDGEPDVETAARALIHPADQERFMREISGMREHGVLDPLRYRIVVYGRIRHMHATLGVVERGPDGRPVRLVGAVRDVTEQRQAEQQVAAHVAVSEALAVWDGLEPGAERLLAGLAEALDAVGGVLWTEEDDALVARVLWHDPAWDHEAFWAATRDARLRRGQGVAGTAWQTGEPVFDHDGSIMRRGPRRAAAAAAGIVADLAIPALVGDEVVAVVELPLHEDGFLTDRLMRSLVGIGHEIGQFLGRRRGLLGASRLSARELEVLQLTARGLTTQQAADELFISAATVKTHLAHIYVKLGATDRAAAVANAMRLGLIA
ncbi:LuxR C-terminal-related transcriptional regulator [Patulibacter americanus]|uniref:helix-turn-helix transcriptional regulator n=1 Tax=Patulibacter americanus TaxID=588672 RepID=UPI0003B35E72|nr:LuxR C-terminal-related transcriptional regulator [Patulibacter americanus]